MGVGYKGIVKKISCNLINWQKKPSNISEGKKEKEIHENKISNLKQKTNDYKT